jgi:hypothetical protein
MIGFHTLNRIATELQYSATTPLCYGEFVIATQRAVYGSGLAPLTRSEVNEVRRFLDLRCGSSRAEVEEQIGV